MKDELNRVNSKIENGTKDLSDCKFQISEQVLIKRILKLMNLMRKLKFGVINII